MDNYSILMSVYSKENPHFFQRALESLFCQTLPTNDFVLICDGPLTVEINEVINRFQDLYPTVLRVTRLQENMGLGNALSVGISLCRNDIIMRADSDDVSLPERAQKELAFLQEGHFDLVSTNLILFSGTENNSIGHRNVPQNKEEILAFARRRSPFNHPSVMFKKQSVISAGNYISLPYKEDYYLWIRMILNGANFSNMSDSLVLMREDGVVKRRKNKLAYKSEVFLLKYMRKTGFISFFAFIGNWFLFTGRFLMPSCISALIYRKILHK